MIYVVSLRCIYTCIISS